MSDNITVRDICEVQCREPQRGRAGGVWQVPPLSSPAGRVRVRLEREKLTEIPQVSLPALGVSEQEALAGRSCCTPPPSGGGGGQPVIVMAGGYSAGLNRTWYLIDRIGGSRNDPSKAGEEVGLGISKQAAAIFGRKLPNTERWSCLEATGWQREC